MDDKREIIYIALCNSLAGYYEILEACQNNAHEDELELLQYTIKRHEEIIDELSQELELEGKPNKTIERPNWG